MCNWLIFLDRFSEKRVEKAFASIPTALPSKTVIEVWNNRSLLAAALKAGHDGILALGWYLDRQVGRDIYVLS